jgi:hypothetical protein
MWGMGHTVAAVYREYRLDTRRHALYFCIVHCPLSIESPFTVQISQNCHPPKVLTYLTVSII